MVMLSPSPATVGAVSADTLRSDPILSERAAVLLVSLVSLTSSPLSALAIRYQMPAAVSPGMLTVVEPALLVPAANPGTRRVPSHTSAPSRVALVERKYFVSEASASLPPVLFVDSLIVILPPGPATAGADRVDTVRSAPNLIDRAVTLLPSIVSATASSASALAIRYQVPAATPVGKVTVVVAVLLEFAASAGMLRTVSSSSPASSAALLDR